MLAGLPRIQEEIKRILQMDKDDKTPNVDTSLLKESMKFEDSPSFKKMKSFLSEPSLNENADPYHQENSFPYDGILNVSKPTASRAEPETNWYIIDKLEEEYGAALPKEVLQLNKIRTISGTTKSGVTGYQISPDAENEKLDFIKFKKDVLKIVNENKNNKSCSFLLIQCIEGGEIGFLSATNDQIFKDAMKKFKCFKTGLVITETKAKTIKEGLWIIGEMVIESIDIIWDLAKELKIGYIIFADWKGTYIAALYHIVFEMRRFIDELSKHPESNLYKTLKKDKQEFIKTFKGKAYNLLLSVYLFPFQHELYSNTNYTIFYHMSFKNSELIEIIGEQLYEKVMLKQ